MTTSINTATQFVVQTEAGTFGIRQGNPGEDAPEAYVSRSALKALVRAALDSAGEPFVVTPEVAAAAGRANLELMVAADKATMATGYITAAASILGAEVDLEGTIAQINGTNEDKKDEDTEV